MASDALSITNITVGITCLVSFILMQNQKGKALLIFHPVTIRRHHQWYRFLTSGFVHADTIHLAINMFVLWSFGSVLEKLWGTSRFVVFYLIAAVVASASHCFVSSVLIGEPDTPALGASGAVMGGIALAQAESPRAAAEPSPG